MPKIKKYIERACWNCEYYEIRVPGGPLCCFYDKFFPNPYGWIKRDGTKKPGERICKNFNVREFNGAIKTGTIQSLAPCEALNK